MKRILFALIFISSVAAFAQEDQNFEAEMVTPAKWTCFGHGVRNMGGPAGPIHETMTGSGSTQFEAFSNTITRCQQMGLQQCGVDYCRQR